MTRAFTAAALALALAGPASAQSAPWAPERTTAGWTFMPSAAIGLMRDTNVTLVNIGAPKTQEWVGLVNPRGELQFNGRLTKFNVGYSGALEAYRETDGLNRYEQRSRASFRRQLSPRLSLDTSASYAASPTTDRLEAGTIPFLDIGSRSTDAGGSLRYSLTQRTAIETDYRFTRIKFDQDAIERPLTLLNGGHAHSPGVRVGYSASTRLGFGAEWQYRHASLQGFERAFGVQNVMGTASYQLGPSTVVTGAAGGSRLHVLATGETQWGPSMRASLQHQVRRISMSASYSRAFVPTFSVGGLSGSQHVSAAVRAPLTTGGRLSVGGSTTFSRTTPVEELGLGFGLDSLTIHGTVDYQFAPWLRTEGFVTSSHQTSTARGNVDRLRIGIQFITSKPMRIE